MHVCCGRFMERERDRFNYPMTILRIPEWVARDLRPDENGNIISTVPPGSPPDASVRPSRTGSTGTLGRKEGLRVQSMIVANHSATYPSAGYDTVDHASPPHEAPPPYSETEQCKGRCRALYEYAARMPDELTLYPGERN